jgi:DNA-binding CsgD family transcriptional regulator
MNLSQARETGAPLFTTPLRVPQGGPALELKHTLASLAETLTAVGSPEFYIVLASQLCPLFGCGRYLAMRYTRDSKPAFLFNHSFSHSAGELYLSSLYEHDPLYRTVRKGISPRVLTLQSVHGQIRLSSYRAALLRHAQISDELAIMLPIVEETAVAVCFNHAAGCFDASAVSLAEAIYPVIREANRLHLERLPTGVALKGRVHQLRSVDKSLKRGSRREPLAKFCKLYRLSTRERELFDLALEGFANRAIASQLDLALGTVKNYKRRLYRKLGVCSECGMLRMVAEFLAAGHAV